MFLCCWFLWNVKTIYPQQPWGLWREEEGYEMVCRMLLRPKALLLGIAIRFLSLPGQKYCSIFYRSCYWLKGHFFPGNLNQLWIKKDLSLYIWWYIYWLFKVINFIKVRVICGDYQENKSNVVTLFFAEACHSLPVPVAWCLETGLQPHVGTSLICWRTRGEASANWILIFLSFHIEEPCSTKKSERMLHHSFLIVCWLHNFIHKVFYISKNIYIKERVTYLIYIYMFLFIINVNM